MVIYGAVLRHVNLYMNIFSRLTVIRDSFYTYTPVYYYAKYGCALRANSTVNFYYGVLPVRVSNVNGTLFHSFGVGHRHVKMDTTRDNLTKVYRISEGKSLYFIGHDGTYYYVNSFVVHDVVDPCRTLKHIPPIRYVFRHVVRL